MGAKISVSLQLHTRVPTCLKSCQHATKCGLDAARYIFDLWWCGHTTLTRDVSAVIWCPDAGSSLALHMRTKQYCLHMCVDEVD